ncbi:hypothetical protein, partial [Streptomyces sp. NPDC005507]|uniref:hypothetical protein n=1 Tax=Streptomyces sp. NPDC005507 TaxID=3154885 RepID=UPI0033A4FCAD
MGSSGPSGHSVVVLILASVLDPYIRDDLRPGSPLDLGFTTLPNRVLMGSMHVGLEEAENGFA